jgi:NAD-dependent deacetylase
MDLELVDLLWEAENAMVFTGAGISTESGIPDFRGLSGVWTLKPELEKLFRISVFTEQPEVRKKAWLLHKNELAVEVSPNAGHYALAELENLGKLQMLVTQNVDGLHQAAGSQNVIELHGSLREAQCLNCAIRIPLKEVFAQMDQGEEDPHCSCGGIFKPAVVFFEEYLPELAFNAAQKAATECELLLAIGSSLQVFPAASLVDIALNHEAKLAIINNAQTDYDPYSSWRSFDSAGAVLSQTMKKLKTKASS